MVRQTETQSKYLETLIGTWEGNFMSGKVNLKIRTCILFVGF